MSEPVITLVIEDAIIRAVVQDVLAGEGHDVVIWKERAADGAVLTAAPTLVILDAQNPSSRPAQERYARVRRASASSPLPIIVFSLDVPSLWAATACLQRLGCTVVPMQFDLFILLDVVADLIGRPDR